MPLDQPARRMTLRDLIMHAEKSCRLLIEHLNASFFTQVADFREVSRPVRRKSHYPTLIALQNALQNLLEANKETQTQIDDAHSQLTEIRDRANKERINRL